MKKWTTLSLCLASLLCLVLFATPKANAATYGDLTYRTSNGEVTITGCNQSVTGNLVIPSTINGYSVTTIGDFAFDGCTSLTDITIPDSVTTIGNSAFSSCTSLTGITIPDSVTTIGHSAFIGCASLTSVTIPDSVTTIGDGAFSSTSLTGITIPDSVTTIGDSAFIWCTSLQSVIIPNSVTTIGSGAFYNCTSLQSVIIPDSVTTIGNYAFYGCSSLTSVTIPDSVTTIGDGAFADCTSLTNITIGKSITGIDSCAFQNCTGLKDVYYTGTQEQWQKITVGTDNTCLTDATIHFNWHTHTFTNYVSNNDATYDADGTKTAKCDYCDATDTIIDEGSRLTPERNEILQQPENVTTDSGETVSFCVEASGEIVSYQWQYRKIYKWFDTTMEGYDTDTLTLTATGQRNGYDYRCVVTYADGTVLISEPAELTVNTNITVTGNPNDQTAALGTKGQFTAAAEGEGIKYQWQYCRPNSEKWIDTAMEGATKPTVLIETTTARDGYQYRCKITDVTGKVTYTEAATLRVLSIQKQPEDQIALTGKTATFTVQTNVTEGVTYQWQYRRNATANWTNTTLTGYNTATLTVGATKTRNGYQYRCVITGAKNGKLTSDAAVLSVSDPVSITAQPKDAAVAATENAVFTVGAANVTAYRWQYSRNGTTWYDTTATGCKTATLTVAAKGKNGYHYRCILTAADGTEIISNSATLTVK